VASDRLTRTALPKPLGSGRHAASPSPEGAFMRQGPEGRVH
jgi:hypothetical protein